MTGHRDTGCFDLFGAQLSAFSSLQPEFSEIQCAATTGDTSHSSSLLFSKFYFFGAQHIFHLLLFVTHRATHNSQLTTKYQKAENRSQKTDISA
jgi:hypothetical protein